jgi:hypothetical protein
MERGDADLSPTECWELLALATVGRMALSVRALPTIVPVRYTLDGASVTVALGGLGLQEASIHDSVVAFAVDHIDEDASAGWIVELQGRVRLAGAPSPPAGPAPVRAGQVIRLTPGTLTGHRFTLHPVGPVR